MKSIMSKASLAMVLFSACVVCSSVPVLAESAFNRNDSHDFAGLHYLRAGGYEPDHFNIWIESASDFRRFKLRIREFNLNEWITVAFRVDMNNDGEWEQDWIYTSELTVSHYYPNPPNGVSANHTIKIEFKFYSFYWGYVDRTKYYQVTVFSTPRVYVNGENDAFIQLRDEDATAKIPVLMVEGFDPLNEKFPEVYYNLTWDLVNTAAGI